MSVNKNSANKPSPKQQRDLASLLRSGCFWLLGLIVAWSMLQPMDSTSVFDGSAMLQNLVWLLLAVLVSLEAIISGRKLSITKIEGLCLAFIAIWLMVVTLNAASSFNPRTGWNGFWHLIAAIALYYSIRSLVTTSIERSGLLSIVLAGAMTLSGVGLYQVTVAFPEMRQQYFSDPERQLVQMGIDAPEGSPTRKRLEDRLNSPEPYATFSLANSLAVLLSGALVGTLGAAAYGLSLRWQSRTKDSGLASRENTAPQDNTTLSDRSILGGFAFAILGLACLLMGSVWFLTRSRVAIAAVPLTLVLMLVGATWQSGDKLIASLSNDLKRKLLWSTSILALLFAAGVIALWWRDPQVITEATKSLSYRFEYWQGTWKIVQRFPLLGIGLGNFQAIYPQFMLPTASETIADPHNWILDLASCCSLPVAVVAVLCIARVLLQKPTGSDVDDNFVSSHRVLAVGAVSGSAIVILGMYIFGQEAGLLAAIFTLAALATLAVAKIFPMLSRFTSHSNLVFKAMAVAMLLCLMISGSWQAPGLLCPLLICLTLSRNSSQETSSSSKSTSGAPQAILLVWLLLVGCFVLWSWKPVLASQTEVAQTFTSSRQQLEAVEKAWQLDPLNAEWDRFRAKLLVELAIAPGEKDRFEANADKALAALEHWTSREPMSFMTWQFAGDQCLQLAAVADQRNASRAKYLDQAERNYDRAVKARPNSVQLHLQLAYCLALQGKFELSIGEIDVSQQLSDKSPHVDQQIQAQLLWTPTNPELSPPNGVRSYGRAEPVVDWIRTQSNR
ncbi:MAG: O-antigen ligase family protein [Pirellulales bacterium]